MLNTSALYDVIRDFISLEQRIITLPGAEDTMLAPGRYAQIAERYILLRKENIFGAHTNVFTLREPDLEGSLKLDISRPDRESISIILYFRQVTDDTLDSVVNELDLVRQDGQAVFVCILKNGSKENLLKWTDAQRESFSLSVLGEPVHLLSSPSANQNGWLYLFNISGRLKTSDKTSVKEALLQAVEGIQYENILGVIKKIIFLRTNVAEDLLLENMALSTIMQMSFAKEQGVSVEEIYDPEAMHGIKDSQLAVVNLISDLQKTFSVKFDRAEIENINTLDDLVKAILRKTKSSTLA